MGNFGAGKGDSMPGNRVTRVEVTLKSRTTVVRFSIEQQSIAL